MALIYVFTQSLPHEQDMTQGQFFKAEFNGWNSELSFS